MSCDVDFDERFFINHNGLQHTPIKLVSPINNYSSTPQALQQHSSTNGKSPISKISSNLASQHQAMASKRPRADSIPLKFVTPDDEDERKEEVKK